MKITIPSGFVEAIGKEIDILAHEALAEMATTQIALIQIRAEKGVGLDDAPMPAYSAAYARIKAKAGRSAAERNLTWSGSMLRAIVVDRVARDENGLFAEIKFATQEQAQIAAYNQGIAPWFGVSPSDQKTLTRVAMRRLEEVAATLNR
jgi:hypothetical protein